MNKWKWILIAIAVAVVAFIAFGCHPSVESEIGERLTTDDARKEVVISITEMKERLKLARATDILRFIFILAVVMGVIAWVRGSSGGWEAAFGGVVGLFLVHFDQKLAQMSWPYVVGVGLIAAGFVCFLYRDRIGKAAFGKKLNGGELTKAEQKIVDKAKKRKAVK